MDYYGTKFDLQLFDADPIAVDLSKVATDLAGNTAYNKVIGANGNVYEDESAATTAGTTAVASVAVTVEEESVSKTITIVAAADASVTVSGATLTQLTGVTISTKAALSGDDTKAIVGFAEGTTLDDITVQGASATSFTVVAKGVKIGENVSATVGENVITETAAGKTVVVTNAGLVVGLEEGSVFSVADGTEDTQATTYTVAKSDSNFSLRVGGDQVGVYATYKTTSEAEATQITNITNVAVNPAAAAAERVQYVADAEHSYSVLVGDVTLSLAANTSGLVASDVATPKVVYYSVAADGTIGSASVQKEEDKAAYFKVTYDPGYGSTANVKVELVSAGSEQGEKTVLALGKVTVDATAVTGVVYSTNQTATDTASLTNITLGDNLSATGTVNVTGIAKGATLDRGTGNADGTTDYAPWYTLDSEKKTIALSGLTGSADGTYYFFEINAADKTAKGEVVYSIAQDKTANRTYSLESDTVKYSDNGGEATAATKSGFLVKIDTDAGNGSKPAYTIQFYKGSGNAPANLKDTCWADGIVVDASGTVANTASITITPDATEQAADKYSVQSVANGILVQEGTKEAGTFEDVSVTRATASEKYTLAVQDKDGQDIGSAGIPLTAGYYVVTRNYEATGTGNPTVTVKETENYTPAAGDSYLKVTVDEGNKKVTVAYTNGKSIPLSGLKDGSDVAIKIPLKLSELQAGWTLDITGTEGAAVDYSGTGLARGVTLKGKDDGDSITYANGDKYNNAVTITLAANVEKETTTYYKLKVATEADPTTGLKKVELGEAYSAEELTEGSEPNKTPATTENYFKVVQTANGASVSYHKADSNGINLNGDALTGQVTVNAAAVSKTTEIVLTNTVNAGKTINKYVVTNAPHDITSVKEDSTEVSVNASETASVSYKEPFEYKLSQTADIALDGTAKTYKVTALTAKGITTYTIAAAGEVQNNASYLDVAVDDNTGKITVSFKEGAAEGAVKLADFAKNVSGLDAITVKADDDLAAKYTTVELADSKDNALKFAVTNLPSTVTAVTHGDSTGDTVKYKATYQFDATKNSLTLSSKEGTVYYEVTAGTPVRGVYTCAIGNALTTKGEDGVAKEASVSDKNYFKVKTESNGNVTVTYHAAEQPEEGSVTSLALTPPTVGTDKIIINVDPTGAPSEGTFTFGEDGGPELTYNVTGLTAGQNVANAGNDSVTKEYVTSYKVRYEAANTTDDLGKISLSYAEGETKYYKVTRSGGTADKNGVYTFLVKEQSDETVKSDGSSYIMVKYTSQYQVSITYVNPNGESCSLTKDGVPKIIVDADGLSGSKIDTINITEASGGDYNGVNYALINVPAAVKENEDGIVGAGTGDTVSYKESAVLAADQTIKLTSDDVAYYTLKAATESGSTTYSLEAAKTGEKNKPADSVNYFSVTKTSGGYTIAYHMATGDGYSFSTETITVDASDVTVAANTSTPGTSAPGSLTITTDSSMGNVKTAVTNAKDGGITVSGGSISYNTAFAWAPGTYFIPVASASDEATVKAGAKSGATEASGSESYVKVTVTTETETDEDTKKTITTYKVEKSDKVLTADANGEIKTEGSTYADNLLTIELPAGVTSFDADSKGFKAITGVKKNDVLTDAGSVSAITTGALAENDDFTVGDKTYVSGAASNEITVTGAGNVTKGALKLQETGVTLAGSTGTSTVKLVALGETNKDGVIVTFEDGKVKSITGLQSGETVDVNDGTNTYHYEYDGNYLHRVLVSGTTGTSGYAASTTGDILAITEWSASKGQTVGQEVTFDTASSTAYVAIGTSTTGDVTVKETAAAEVTATAGTYYVKAATDADKVLSLSVFKANADKMLEPATDYTGTITVDVTGASSFKYTGNATENAETGASVNGSAYKVAFTNVISGAVFAKLDSDDTIVSGELSTNDTIEIDNITYKIAENGTLKFTGSTLTDGVITVTGKTTEAGAADVAVLPDGVKVSYNDNDTGSTAGTATITVVDGEITSIKNLGTNETISINDGETITTYTTATSTGTAGDGKAITKTVKTIATGESVSSTATIDAENGEVLKGITYTASGKSYNNDFSWAAGKEGYFQLTGTSSLVTTVEPSSTPVAMVENNTYVKATVKQKEGGESGDLELTLTPYTVKNGAFSSTSLYNATVSVTAPTSGTLTYAASGQTYNVNFTGVTKDSDLTLKNGDTVTTASLSDGDTITLNGQTITSKAGTNPITLYSTGSSSYGVVRGTVLVDETTVSYDLSSTAKVANIVTYEEGTAETSQDGVIVAFGANGVVSTITDLDKGETVTVTDANGKTTVYEAISTTVVARTVTGDSVTANNKTMVADLAVGTDIVGGNTFDDIVELTKAFSTKITSDAQTGYFLVDSDARTATIQDVDEDTVIATYRDAGKTVIVATLATDGTLTLTKKTLEKTGAVPSAAGTAFSDGDVENLTLKVTGGQAIQYTKQTGIANVSITGAGNGSKFTSFVDGDTVTTASLSAASNEKVTFGSTDYVAGADGTMTFHGEKAYSGTFKVTNTALTTTITDDTTKATTATTIKYTAGTGNDDLKDGVVVTISEGYAGSVTDLELHEKVEITESVTYKDGSTKTIKTTYHGKELVTSGSQKDMLTVERTVDIDGVVTRSEQVFKSDGSADVTKESGWTTTGKTTSSYFQFGDTTDAAYTTTGYFAASEGSDGNAGKYRATVAAQDRAETLGDEKTDAGYYLKATATKDVTGAITFSEMKLMKLETSGTWSEATDKELYSVTVTAPDAATVTLADHAFPVVYNVKGTNSKVANVGASDTVNFDVQAADDAIVVNSVTYTAVDNTTDMVIKGVVNADGTKTSAVTTGNLVVKAQAAMAAESGDVVSYDKGTNAGNDGAIVEIFNGKVTAIKDLEVGEIVTVTSADGTVTTYECATKASNNVYTKTITTKDGLTSEWTFSTATSGVTDATFDVIARNYGVSPKFAFPTEAGESAQGFFEVTGSPAKATIAEKNADTPAISLSSDSDHVVRAVVEKDEKGTGYTITALQVLEGQTLKDVSSNEAPSEVAPAYTVSFAAPSGASVTVGDIWTAGTPKTETDVVYRDFKIAIENAGAGQTYTGLADTDTVTTTQFAAGDIVTVGTYKFAADANGILQVKGDGTAVSGSFKVSSQYTVAGDHEIVTSNKEAMVVVVGGVVKSIYKVNSGETVTVTNTSTGQVDTYVGKTVNGKLEVTRTSVVDGVKTIATATVTDGDDILAGDYIVGDNGNQVFSKFDWTTLGGTGYFPVTETTVDGSTTGTATVEPQKTGLTITKNNAGTTYVKVSLTDGTTAGSVKVSGISLQTMQADGTMAAYDGSLEGALAITAPTATPLELDLLTDAGTAMPADANVAVNITGAIKDSKVVLGTNDTLTTAALSDGNVVTVNGKEFTAGATTTLKFVAANSAAVSAGAVLSGGTVKFAGVTNATPVSFVAAGADNKAGTAGDDTDNVTVTYTQTTGIYPETPVVTVTNGIVTAISGFANNGNTISTSASGVKVTYTAVITRDTEDPTKITSSTINASVAAETTGTLTGKTFTLAALAKGATVSGVGSLTSGADNNSITVVNEGTTATIKNGVLQLANGQSFTATGASTATDDDVVVAQTGTGNAIVTVQNGAVTSITGVTSGDTVTTTAYASDGAATPTYTCTITSYAVANGVVTRTAKVGTGTSTSAAENAAKGATAEYTTVTTAYISGSSDLMAANYFSDTEDSTETLVGQFSWNSDIKARQTGYFKLNGSEEKGFTGTIGEQPEEKSVVATKNATVRYAVANIDKDSAALTISGLDVTNETSGSGSSAVSKTTMAAVAASDASFLGSTITVTAPTDQSIAYDKGTGANAAKFGVVINKLAKDSAISHLDTGDKVVTDALNAGDTVTMGTVGYVAGAKGTLTFIGEGDSAADTPTNRIALLAGTIQLTAGQGYYLAGGKETDEVKTTANTDNDITVTYTNAGGDPDTVLVKAANGVITSVTGLVTAGDTVTVSDGTNLVTYDVVGGDGTMIRRRESTVAKPTTYTATSYKTVAVGKEIYSAVHAKNGYTEAVGTALSDLSFAAPSSGTKTTTAYYKLGSTTTVGADTDTIVNAGSVESLGDSLHAGDSTMFDATPDNYYLKVVASTTNKGVTTIKSVDLMKSGANGTLASVKAATASYGGVLTLSGQVSEGVYTDLKYTLPKSRAWNLTVTNAGLGSTFTNLLDGDEVSTVRLTDEMGTLAKGGTYTLYHADTTNHITETRKVVVSGGDGVVITTDANGEIATLTGLSANSEKVTITKTTATGLVVTEYAVDSKGETITKTETDKDGVKEVYRLSTVDGSDVINAAWGAATATTVVWDFDWSTNRNLTGYFAVNANRRTATAATGKGKIEKTGTDYIALTINADGRVSAIDAQTYSASGMTNPASKFTGTLTIKAPTAYPLQLDRDKFGANIDADNTVLVVENAVSDSQITGLTAGDKVTTANLAIANAAKSIAAGTVTVNDAVFTAGAAGKLGFLVQTVGNYGEQATLTTGTAKISEAEDGAGKSFLYVGSSVITATKGAVTVQATGNGAGFTIGDLDEGETFTVEDTTKGVTYSYSKSGTTLLRTYNNESGDSVTEVYAINSAKKIDSKVMDGKAWNLVTATLDKTDADTGAVSSSHYKTITADLAAVDKRIAADTKASTAAAAQGNQYDFVVDTYMYFKNSNVQANLAAQVVDDTNKLADLQTVIGGAVYDNITGKWAYYATEDGTSDGTVSKVGQTIKAAKDWNVYGSNADDIITGASSSSKDVTVTINGGEGDDSITAGGASENFIFGFGGTSGTNRDTLKGYTAVKDKLTIDRDGDGFDDGGNFAVQLDTAKGGNVFLFADDSNDGVYDSDENGVELMAVAGKAVTIGNATYYFGNGALSGNNTKTTAGANFTYETGAYYIGNDSGKNTLKVTTDKTKASKTTLGDTVTVDLTKKDDDGRSYYTNIDTVDASASNNTMVLTASATGSTLKGGKYLTTLKGGAGDDVLQGGSGADVFWFESGLDGKDTIKSYTAKQKDAVYLGAWDSDSKAYEANGFTVKADGTNVVLSNGSGLGQVTVEKAVSTTTALRISTDGTSENAVNYYVGKNGTTNASGKVTLAKNNFTATLGTDTADVTSGTLTSYYLGSDTATDTLTVKLASKQTQLENATFSLASNHLKSIDVLDTSGISIKGLNVTLQGAESGTFTLKGEAAGKTTDHFDLTELKTGSNQVTISNLNVGEIIELASGVTLKDGGYDTKAKAYSYTMMDGNDSLGTLYITGTKTALTAGTVGGEGANKDNVTLKR